MAVPVSYYVWAPGLIIFIKKNCHRLIYTFSYLSWRDKLTKWLLLHTGSGFQWYRTYERGYETSGSPLRFMLRRSSLVECVSVLHGTGVCKASQIFLFVNMYSHVCQKILSTHFIPYSVRLRSHIIKPDKVLGHSTHKFFFCLLVLVSNMKSARPWMLAHLKIIWQFHTHPVHQKVSRFFGPRYIGDDFF